MGGRGGPGRAPQPASSQAAFSPMGRAALEAIRQLRGDAKDPWVAIPDIRERLGGDALQQNAVLRNLARKGEISFYASNRAVAAVLPDRFFTNPLLVKGKAQLFAKLK